MKYKITSQYARDTEHPLAEFGELKDANFFIERKILSDNEKSLILIYRLYDNHKLIKEFNKEKITSRINNGQYAEGDRDLPDSLGPYQVSQADSKEKALAGFIDLKDAELFVEDTLTQTSPITTYYILKNGSLLSEVNQLIKKQVSSEDSTQGMGNKSSPGSPHKWLNDDEHRDKK